MVRLYIRHAVDDFEKWLHGYKAAEGARKAAGVRGDGVHQSLDDPLDVTLWHDFDDEGAARKFGEVIGDKDAAARMGVVSTPIIWLTQMA